MGHHWHVDMDGIVPGLVVLGVLLAIAHATARHSRFYHDALAALSVGRYGELDGLRGFLASLVFISHIVSSYYWWRTGQWGWPPSVVYTLCGSAPVTLFFMVTGFLFWRRAAAQGRIDTIAFLRGRWRRLAPLYFTCLALILVVVAAETKGVLAAPPLTLARSLLQWASFGLFGFPDINGIEHTRLIDPAVWTLPFEWLFYLALPALAILASPARLAALTLLAGAAILVGGLAPFDHAITSFLIGMITAQIAVSATLPPFLRSRSAATAALLLVVALACVGDGDLSVGESLALAPLFAAVVAGNDLFGALSLRAARCLGLASYSIYLLHGIVLRALLDVASRFLAVGDLQPVAYWLLMLPVAALVVAASLATYRWIEHPFLSPPPRVPAAALANKPA